MAGSSRWLAGIGVLLCGVLTVRGQTTNFPGAKPAWPPAAAAPTDELLLLSLGVGTDGPALLHFLRQRTLTAYRLEISDGQRTLEARGADQERLAALVRQLGAAHFAQRTAAGRALIHVGPPALAVLRQAVVNADPEVRSRAEGCIRAIEQTPGASLPAAAVRLLRQRPAAGACAVLLNFAGLAPDETVEEEVLLTLRTVGLRGGRLDPAFLAALTAADPEQRAAAAFIVGQLGNGDERPHVRRLLGDADLRVRLRAAQGLLAGRELGAVPVLVGLVGEAAPDVARSAEDVLHRLAGDRAPRVERDGSAAGRRRCQEAWLTWWRSNQDRLELTRGPEYVVLNPRRRAREAGERFLQAYSRFDLDGMKAVTDLPFHEVGEDRIIRTRARLDDLYRDALNFRGDGDLSWTVGAPLAFADYARQLSPARRAALVRYRRPDVYVLPFDVRSADGDGDPFGLGGMFIVRVGNGGPARVLAIASEDHLPRPR